MDIPSQDARTVLDDIVCDGVALDVYQADQARLLLEDLDGFLEQINRTGIGKRFFANLQGILQRELVLSVTRIYEPFSERNPGRTLRAATHHIAAHARELRLVDRTSVTDFLVGRGESRSSLECCSEDRLSLLLAADLEAHLPQADTRSSRQLDKALNQLKMVRDKRIAHHDRVSHSTLLVPGWLHIWELINSARETTVLLAHAYLSVGYSLESDAKQASQSLRGLLKRAGLSENSTQPEAKHEDR